MFRRSDAAYWQGVAGSGEADEAPLQAARREADEETGLAGDCEFVALDTRAAIPLVYVAGEFTWGPDVPVIPEYAFGVRVEESELTLSQEYTEYGRFALKEAAKAVQWDSNRTVLWELDHWLRHGTVLEPRERVARPARPEHSWYPIPIRAQQPLLIQRTAEAADGAIERGSGRGTHVRGGRPQDYPADR